jgi:tungstate transport system ATP-binding protein
MSSIYELQEVTKTYDTSTALYEVTFSITDPVTAIIGYSGAGKTTLLKLLAGLDTPSSGTIRYRGTVLTRQSISHLRQEATMLFQDPVFFNQSVGDNIAYGLRRRGVTKTEANHKTLRLLNTLGLEGFEKRKAASLSGGEQQRVALARALILEPRVLLLDEPTSNLDPSNMRVILNLIKRVAEKTHIIIATHDFRHVVELADRIAILINGELKQFDSPQKIFNEPRSKETARFVGIENILQGTVTANTNGVAHINMGNFEIYVVSPIDSGAVNVFIRPESIILSIDRFKSSARNNIEGRIAEITQIGNIFRIVLDNQLIAFITKQSIDELEIRVGKTVYASFKATAAYIQKR